MDKETKQQHEDLAQFAEERAEEALETALRFSALSGPQSGLNNVIEAGALLAAAAELRKRAK